MDEKVIDRLRRVMDRRAVEGGERRLWRGKQIQVNKGRRLYVLLLAKKMMNLNSGKILCPYHKGGFRWEGRGGLSGALGRKRKTTGSAPREESDVRRTRSFSRQKEKGSHDIFQSLLNGGVKLPTKKRH